MSPRPAQYKPEEVLPHGGAMVLLDEILGCSEDRIVARAMIKPTSLFLKTDNLVPAWVGLEYMAQSIAAWEGINAKLSGRAVEIGYLIGTRSYRATGQGFCLGDNLEITAQRIQREGPLAVFACEIANAHCGVEGTVTVYRSKLLPVHPEL